MRGIGRYMVCYAVGGRTEQSGTEYFDNFADAVLYYTKCCGEGYGTVVLADMQSNQIIRQLSWVGYGDGCSLAIN